VIPMKNMTNRAIKFIWTKMDTRWKKMVMEILSGMIK